ncbi:hypothetical protein RhiirA4_477776 [Rhizophagus irregularis]|uniref:Uncharacterized protein n=1 Tax=Rhizophagus irregularis TaxID=588596 RepID=A0A2I1HDS3_9GLOM|nr:hypothetical protein RhiirA4_477776 [Rhizophagus irregularis]
MVSSPKKSIIGDFAKQWYKKLYMPIWNEFEVEDCWKNILNRPSNSTCISWTRQAKDFSGDEFTHKLIHIRTNLEETEVEENKEDLRTFIETAMGSLCGQLFKLVSHEILGTFPVCKLADDGALGPETTPTLESLEEIFI